jgi:hypothetical protein
MSREFDVAMGKALNYKVEYVVNVGWVLEYPDGTRKTLPYFSTDGSAMLELDREMRERGYEICNMECEALPFINKTFWSISYRKPDHFDYDVFHAQANTEPLARALAAYKALTGKKWEDEKI